LNGLIKDNNNNNNNKQRINKRKVERPSYNDLLNYVNINGYSATGRKYGVSDNAIRKWIKYYEKTENIMF